MDRATADLIVAAAPLLAVAALLFVVVLWRPLFLRRLIERHPRGIDRVFRAACLGLFAYAWWRGEGWRALFFLLFASVGTALGRRRKV